ncbi:uncharacterized protein [Palaemon carinicauda]|uniref:uncharacterized protein n=1 Tax=Palaemon carinicauda TaxID=392227 RepID=UPI0035B60593
METVTSALCTSAVLSGIGIPEHKTSESGTKFTSPLTSLVNLLGITLHLTTAYNPAAKGMIDRFHWTLKAALMCLCKDSNWFTQLPWVLLELSTNPKDTLHVLAAEMMFGVFSVNNHLRQSLAPTSSYGKIYSMAPDLQAPAKQHIPTDLHKLS